MLLDRLSALKVDLTVFYFCRGTLPYKRPAEQSGGICDGE